MTLRGIPRYGLALLDALRFRDTDPERLRTLSDSEWQRVLKFCDQAQLTLLLGHLCREHLPHWVRSRIDANHAGYACRFARLQSRVLEITQAFSARSIPFVLVKGFAQAELFAPQAVLRAQGDIDIWCLPGSIERAHRVLGELGYRSAGVSNRRHLPPMIRETHWGWCDDYFAPDLPIPVDLHYQLWDSDRECFSGPDEAELWKRRMDGAGIPVLDPADALAFAAFHLLMHLLHGDLRLQRAWEIAFFLETHSDDQSFWSRWARLYTPAVLRPQIIIFLLVHHWFRCNLPSLPELPPDMNRWIQRFGFSPVENLFTPNKHELWLNLSLVESRRDQLRIALRRLFPLNSTGLLNAPAKPLARCAFILRRIAHHLRTLLSWRLITAGRRVSDDQSSTPC